EITPDDRRRCLRVVELVHLFAVSLEPRGQIDDARVAEGLDRLAGRGVDRDQVPTTVDEDPTLFSVGPRRDAAVAEARAVRGLTGGVRLGIISPEFLTRRRVERDDTVVRRAQKERVTQHERRRLEISRTRAELWLGRLPGGPFPRFRQA